MKNIEIKPPKCALWLLDLFSRKIYSDSIGGDCEEMYEYIYHERGKVKALFWLWKQVFKSIPLFIVNSIEWRITMFKNYLKISIRNILKHKGYSFINITGLAVGMAICILIFLWVQDELSFDRFHKNSNEIYRVTTEYKISSSGKILPIAVTPWPLGEALKNDFPGVLNFTRLLRMNRTLLKSGEKKIYENGLYAVDPSFFEIFTFPFVKGEPTAALSKPHTIVITGEMAQKYFGEKNPVGKTISTDNNYDFIVTGVIKNVPHHSHLKFDFLVPFEPTLKDFKLTGGWEDNNYYTYILLQEKTSVETLREKIYEYRRRAVPETSVRFKLQPLTGIHLRSSYEIDLHGYSENRFVYIYVFSLIAVFILLIACINFMNLTTAKSANRAKEVGLRKVVGARRMDLIKQFYGESILLTIVAMCFGIVLVYLLLPLFNDLSEKELTLDLVGNITAAFGLILIVSITGIIAGSYPALIQSSFQPAKTIKGALTFTKGKTGKTLSRKVLVVFQFTLSITLIIGTLVVYKQVSYMQDKKLGYEKDHVIYFTKRGNLMKEYNTFKEELQKNSNVLGVTASSDVQTFSLNSTSAVDWEGREPEARMSIHQFSVDYDYFKTFKIEIAEGRAFSRDFTTDADSAYIVNEAAVEAMGMKEPVGKRFTLWSKKGTIIGVVKDFHYKSLHKKVEPLVLRIEPERDRYIFMKLKSENIFKTLDSIQKVYKKFDSQYPFEFTFLDDAIDRLYNNDRRTFKIFNYFTIIAISISCLGLFGLAAFMAQQRTREIGVRKVLGASITNIVLLLSKEFLVLVVLANIFAWPTAYFVMNNWLQNFAYRTVIGYGTFILSSLLVLFIAITTVSYQSIKAAYTNPVDALKYE